MQRIYHLLLVAMACLIILGWTAGHTEERDERLLDALVHNLLHPGRYIRTEAIRDLDALNSPAALPALIELLRFGITFDTPVIPIMERLAGEPVGSEWSDWVEWLQKHEEIRPNPGFLAWKSFLFSRLDPNFVTFLSPGVAYRIRLEEIVWGGVRKDGIPALTNPRHVKPEAATYLAPEDLVFGVSINGDHRAYPLRILDWHEMFNDVVGGQPITLAY
jgi:hypothetical protein